MRTYTHLWLLAKLRVDDCQERLKGISCLLRLGAIHACVVCVHHTQALVVSVALVGGQRKFVRVQLRANE